MIHFKTLQDNWYAVSASTPDGLDWYARYHQDNENVTGFTMAWNNANGDVKGDRLAALMSASLYSDMTGAPFMDPLNPADTNGQAAVAPGSGPPSPVAQPPTMPSPPASQPVGAEASPQPAAPTNADSFSSGTGFFVDQKGSFVTAAHVIAGCSVIKVKADDGEIFDAQQIAVDSSNDLALLRLPKTPRQFVTIRAEIRLGEEIETFGFPHVEMLSSGGNFTLGNVTALTGLGDDSRYIQISAPVQAGNSGGPVLDTSGNLVGIVEAKLDAVKVAAAEGDLPQNINFALKASALAEFLSANRVTMVSGTLSSTTMQPADLADKARAASGFVVCR